MCICVKNIMNMKNSWSYRVLRINKVLFFIGELVGEEIDYDDSDLIKEENYV